MNYTHLIREEQYQIYDLKKVGNKQNKIVNVLKHSPSPISRELHRNLGGRGNHPKRAKRFSDECRATNVRQMDDVTWQFAQDKLLKQGNPE